MPACTRSAADEDVTVKAAQSVSAGRPPSCQRPAGSDPVIVDSYCAGARVSVHDDAPAPGDVAGGAGEDAFRGNGGPRPGSYRPAGTSFHFLTQKRRAAASIAYIVAAPSCRRVGNSPSGRRSVRLAVTGYMCPYCGEALPEAGKCPCQVVEVVLGHAARVAKRRSDSWRRDKMQASGPVEALSAVQIGDRDSWICGICQDGIRLVDPRPGTPRALTPSIGHNVPVSGGGPHVRANADFRDR